jgi:hypothetical protein
MDKNQAVPSSTQPDIRKWFLRAEEALYRDDPTALSELGVELQHMLLDAVLKRDVGRVWSLYLHFMELSRQQEVTAVRLNWFPEPSMHDWITAMAGQIDGSFEPAEDGDKAEFLRQVPKNETPALLASVRRMIEANPALIEREDHDALTNLANGIRERLDTAVSAQEHALVLAIFYKIENDRRW